MDKLCVISLVLSTAAILGLFLHIAAEQLEKSQPAPTIRMSIAQPGEYELREKDGVRELVRIR
ncbi:hypothetical protein [Paraburkholderia sediminicola]|uniref:hypothetical protein n=1 Tax=Paraburkholderia sediminicola TaxID=458836 RepID=UPI0038BA8161